MEMNLLYMEFMALFFLKILNSVRFYTLTIGK